MEFIDGVLTTLIYITAGFILFLVGKWVYALFNPRVNVAYQLVEADNVAFAFAYVGYFTGLIISIGSAMTGETSGLATDLVNIAIYGGLAIFLLNLSRIINNKVILSKFDLRHEILENHSIGVGIIQGGNGIATGLIVLGAISGDGYGFAGPIANTIAYWLLGQVILFITSKVYDFITPYNFQEHASKGNIAVAIGYAGAIIAIANLIRNALSHDFISWIITLEDVAFEVLLGLVFLPLARYFSDKILLPGQNLTDELINQEKPNVGAALIEGFSYIGGSMLIVWAI